MDKVIPFNKGIHRQPSLGSDGELSECVNLIPKNGELVNVRPLTDIGIDDMSPLSSLKALHKVENSENYIVSGLSLNNDKVNLYFYRKDGGSWKSGTIKSGIAAGSDFNVVAVGNVLFITTNEGLKYAMWKGDNYKWLDAMPLIKTVPFLRTETINHSAIGMKYSDFESSSLKISEMGI